MDMISKTGSMVVTAPMVGADSATINITPGGVKYNVLDSNRTPQRWKVHAASAWLTDAVGIREGIAINIDAITLDDNKPALLRRGYQMVRKHISLESPREVIYGISFSAHGGLVANDVLSFSILYEAIQTILYERIQ